MIKRPGFQKQLHRFPSVSNNGTLVHLATRFGSPCNPGSDTNRVYGRITCTRCLKRWPRAAKRHDHKPHVVGLDFRPLYAAIERALDAGETKMPKVKVSCWPKLKEAVDAR